MPAPAPRIVLPSQRDIDPNLSILIGLVEKLLAHDACGPREAARICADLSSNLRRAGMNTAVPAMIAGPLVIGPEAMIAAADWFLAASIACARCQQ